METFKTPWARVLGSLLQVTLREQGLVSIPKGPCGPQRFRDLPRFSPESPWERGGPGGIAPCPVVPGEEGCGGFGTHFGARETGRADGRVLPSRRI